MLTLLPKIRSRLTYANLVSTLCLFIVLGGSSYAAVTLQRNAVRSKHIKNGQVKRADIARNAIDSSRVRDGSLLGQDFAPGQLPSGEAGQQGPAGQQGAAGEQGPAGPAGSARAWGHVLSNGSLGASKGVKSVTPRSPGNRYCIVLDDSIDPATTTIIASMEGAADTTSERFFFLRATGDLNACTAGAGGIADTDFVVETFSYDGDGTDDDDGGGNTTGDDLTAFNTQFSFVVP